MLPEEKKRFRVVVKETRLREYIVDADSEEDAKAVMSGEIVTTNNPRVLDSDYEIEYVEELAQPRLFDKWGKRV